MYVCVGLCFWNDFKPQAATAACSAVGASFAFNVCLAFRILYLYFQIKEDASVNARICLDKKLPGTDGRIAMEQEYKR